MDGRPPGNTGCCRLLPALAPLPGCRSPSGTGFCRLVLACFRKGLPGRSRLARRRPGRGLWAPGPVASLFFLPAGALAPLAAGVGGQLAEAAAGAPRPVCPRAPCPPLQLRRWRLGERKARSLAVRRSPGLWGGWLREGLWQPASLAAGPLKVRGERQPLPFWPGRLPAGLEQSLPRLGAGKWEGGCWSPLGWSP